MVASMASFAYVACMAVYLSTLPSIPSSFVLNCVIVVCASVYGIELRSRFRGTVCFGAIESLVIMATATPFSGVTCDMAPALVILSIISVFGISEPWENQIPGRVSYLGAVQSMNRIETWNSSLEHTLYIALATLVNRGRTVTSTPFDTEYVLVVCSLFIASLLLRCLMLPFGEPSVIRDRVLPGVPSVDVDGELVEPYIQDGDSVESASVRDDSIGAVRQRAQRVALCTPARGTCSFSGAHLKQFLLAMCTTFASTYSMMMLVFASKDIPLGLLLPMHIIVMVDVELCVRTPAYRMPSIIRNTRALAGLLFGAIVVSVIMARLAPSMAPVAHLCMFAVLVPMQRVVPRDALLVDEDSNISTSDEVRVLRVWHRYVSSHVASMLGRVIACAVSLAVHVYTSDALIGISPPLVVSIVLALVAYRHAKAVPLLAIECRLELSPGLSTAPASTTQSANDDGDRRDDVYSVGVSSDDEQCE